MKARPVSLPGPRQQRGLVFYAFVVITIFVMLSLFGAQAFFQDDRARRDERILELTRDAILAHLASPDLDSTGRRLGQFGLMPDLAFNGQGAAYKNCAYKTWLPGQALSTSVDSLGASARCFGRVPWQALGLDLGSVDSVDLQGRIPWIVLSPNLAATSACMPNLTPLVVGSAVNNTCPGAASQLPFPWITVVDERGNVISNRVAFALILPGAPTGNQVRSLTAGPSAWLNSLQVNAGCPVPCTPGTYDNSLYTQPNGTPTTIVTTKLSDDGLQHLPWLGDPKEFHNRVVYVTVDEYFRYMETRARKTLINALLAFRNTAATPYFPYAAAFNTPDGSCVTGQRFGHPPIAAGNCGAGYVTMPAWWTNAGWYQYFVYAASPTCIASSHACGAPGLTLNGTSGYNALLIGPGAPITTAPFAPSRVAPQAPIAIGYLSASPADYIDSVANANGGTTGVFASVAGNFTVADDDREDVVQ